MYQLEFKAEICQGGFVQRRYRSSWPGRGCVPAGAEVHRQQLTEVDFLVLFVFLVGLKPLESIVEHRRLPLWGRKEGIMGFHPNAI